MRFSHPIHAFLGQAAQLLHRYGMPVHSLEERQSTAGVKALDVLQAIAAIRPGP